MKNQFVILFLGLLVIIIMVFLLLNFYANKPFRISIFNGELSLPSNFVLVNRRTDFHEFLGSGDDKDFIVRTGLISKHDPFNLNLDKPYALSNEFDYMELNVWIYEMEVLSNPKTIAYEIIISDKIEFIELSCSYEDCWKKILSDFRYFDIDNRGREIRNNRGQ